MDAPLREAPSEFQGYRRVSPTSVVDAHANEHAAPTLAVQPRWLRIVKIIAVHTVLAPLIAGAMMFIVVVGWNLSIKGDAYNLGLGVGFVPMLVILVALPWALLTSTVHAMIAVLSGWRHLFVAVAVALLPAPFFPWLLLGAVPVWRWSIGMQVSIFALIALPTTICWYLSRRWHSRIP